jgi:hypothetical protein
MADRDPLGGPRWKDRRTSTQYPRDVPVAGLLRDSIVGITCFPDPLPRRSRKPKSRQWSRPAKRAR